MTRTSGRSSRSSGTERQRSGGKTGELNIRKKKKSTAASEDEGTAVKKKKAPEPADKTSKALAKLGKRSELIAKAGTTFGVHSKQLYSMIQEGQSDQAIIVFQRQMLATVLRLIPIAEKQYRKEKRESSAYAMNSLISQARELSADIQSSADRARVAEVIVTDIMMPTFRSFVETVVTEAQTLKGILRSKVRPEHQVAVDHSVDEVVKAIARTGNELFRVNSNSIRDMLGAPKKRGLQK